jgi:hypothetical protein
MKSGAIAIMTMVAVAVLCTPSVGANLLGNPGFETNVLETSGVLNDFEFYKGRWGAELGTISGAGSGVTPNEGAKMLRMTATGGDLTQTFQVIDVRSWASVIDGGGATVNFNSLFNADCTDANLPTARGLAGVQFFSDSYYASEIGTGFSSDLRLDGFVGSWEGISTGGAVPVNTRWVVAQVTYYNSSLAGYPGYVDAAELTVVPEPATMSLLALGGVGALLRRKQQRV